MPLMLGADNVEHVDTNCLFVASRAFDLLPLWGTWPAELSRIDDRVFWRLVTARGHASAFTGALTTCYEASHFSFYRTLGEIAPAGTRPDLDLVALFAWHEGIAAAERADLDERLGFSVASLLASLCPPALAR
jgi:hypothetical protein